MLAVKRPVETVGGVKRDVRGAEKLHIGSFVMRALQTEKDLREILDGFGHANEQTFEFAV